MLDYVLTFQGEANKVKNKNVEYDLCLRAHKGSDFDSFAVINNLPQGRSVAKLVRNRARIFSLKIFIGYLDSVKKAPQYVHFRCERVHITSSLTKISVCYKLQPFSQKL